MNRLSESALNECVAEIRAACRRPIDELALQTMLSWLQPQFEEILDHPHGASRWADHGQRMRDCGRHLGALAEFFASHKDTPIVGLDELKRALEMLRADCTVRSERVPLALHYCTYAPLDPKAAEDFLRTVAPAPELV